jgi:hypothetical protein
MRHPDDWLLLPANREARRKPHISTQPGIAERGRLMELEVAGLRCGAVSDDALCERSHCEAAGGREGFIVQLMSPFRVAGKPLLD